MPFGKRPQAPNAQLSMTTPELPRILDQFDRGYRGDAWHGTPVRTILADVDAATAARRFLPGTHTIWEVTRHLITWLDVPRRRVNGEAVDPSGDQDWPTVRDTSPAAWTETLKELDSSFERLLDSIRRLEDARLGDPIAGKDYNMYVLLHGTLQHLLYHGGQIALLARAARESA